jgi:hypothetical protein
VVPSKENIDINKCNFIRPEDKMWMSSSLLTRLVGSLGSIQYVCAIIKYDDFLVNIYSKELKEI